MGKFLVYLPPGGVPDGYLELAVARSAELGMDVLGLYVVDSVWKRYSSADWLSTGPSRSEFDAYMEETLLSEGGKMASELSELCAAAGVGFGYAAREGDPADEVSAEAESSGAAAAVIPQGMQGIAEALSAAGCAVFASGQDVAHR